MKGTILISLLVLVAIVFSGCSAGTNNTPLKVVDTMPNKKAELANYVTKEGGTERPFQNEYFDNKKTGIYVDVNTGEPLFSSDNKFDSGTGWPAFTEAIPGSSIEIKTDTSQGMVREEVRTEESHLGHVFDDGPDGQARYCINSAALRFIPYNKLDQEGLTAYKSLFTVEEATFAGGCFWGVEHLFEQEDGVIDAVSGYMGGDADTATYKQVSTGKTGHAEAVHITYDPNKISYEELVNLFWRMHDPTQLNRQGYDIGSQYRSAIFYYNGEQKAIAESSKEAFDAKGVFDTPAVTQIVPADAFYPAEDYHQDYVENNPRYVCHTLREE